MMTDFELDLFQRVNQVIRELRSGWGPMVVEGCPPAGFVSRDALAARLVAEVAAWAESIESAEKGGSDA